MFRKQPGISMSLYTNGDMCSMMNVLLVRHLSHLQLLPPLSLSTSCIVLDSCTRIIQAWSSVNYYKKISSSNISSERERKLYRSMSRQKKVVAWLPTIVLWLLLTKIDCPTWDFVWRKGLLVAFLLFIHSSRKNASPRHSLFPPSTTRTTPSTCCTREVIEPEVTDNSNLLLPLTCYSCVPQAIPSPPAVPHLP